jgi:hypothetical protein
MLIGPQREPGKLKTKIRRLCDIANILSSLRLIEKCQLTADAEARVQVALLEWSRERHSRLLPQMSVPGDPARGGGTCRLVHGGLARLICRPSTLDLCLQY